jgi:hypothetical protein
MREALCKSTNSPAVEAKDLNNVLAFAGPTRFARIGICLSVLLPIFCCEFLFLNLVAIPAYHNKVWVATLDVPSELSSPSFALLFNHVFTSITSNCTAMREAVIPYMRCLDRSQRRILVGGEADQVEIYDASDDTYKSALLVQ